MNSFESISERGFVEATYTCSMNLVSLRSRCQLASNFGGWHLPDDREKLGSMISWWSVLDDVPREVIMVLEFLTCNFPTLGKAFEAIDVNKDKSLTFREFVSVVKFKMRDLGFGLAPEAREALKRKKRQEAEEKQMRLSLKRTSSSLSRSSLNLSSGGKEDSSKCDSNNSGKIGRIDEVSEKINSGGPDIGEKEDTESKDKRKDYQRTSTIRKTTEPDLGKMEDYSKLLKQGIDDDRLNDILSITFKFLDPNNDTELSQLDFGVLEGIWRELMLTMWEFYQHLLDILGSLENAWAHADEDGNQSMEMHEFEKLARTWHFDGPVRQIFMYLDQDGNGNIGFDEWMRLATVENPKVHA
jgi:Ca2+-binding EF-hand superfamily protein